MDWSVVLWWCRTYGYQKDVCAPCWGITNFAIPNQEHWWLHCKRIIAWGWSSAAPWGTYQWHTSHTKYPRRQSALEWSNEENVANNISWSCHCTGRDDLLSRIGCTKRPTWQFWCLELLPDPKKGSHWCTDEKFQDTWEDCCNTCKQALENPLRWTKCTKAHSLVL